MGVTEAAGSLVPVARCFLLNALSVDPRWKGVCALLCDHRDRWPRGRKDPFPPPFLPSGKKSEITFKRFRVGGARLRISFDLWRRDFRQEIDRDWSFMVTLSWTFQLRYDACSLSFSDRCSIACRCDTSFPPPFLSLSLSPYEGAKLV